MFQVEDGLMDGEVLFHELVEKTEEEKALIKKKREEKRYEFWLRSLHLEVVILTMLSGIIPVKWNSSNQELNFLRHGNTPRKPRDNTKAWVYQFTLKCLTCKPFGIHSMLQFLKMRNGFRIDIEFTDFRV